MHLLYVMLALLAAPFWETTAPKDWSDDDLQMLLNDSPWAQAAEPDPKVQVYLATARPIREAETELARRSGKPLNDDYEDYLKEEGTRNLVLAVAFPNGKALADAKESQRMQEESIMQVGRKKYQIVGYFPPIPSDPYLRLVFPRAVTANDKSVLFELYLPRNGPYHEAEFSVREMMYKGKLEM
jgi:hypothetical protein